jgi:hypothetical protein
MKRCPRAAALAACALLTGALGCKRETPPTPPPPAPPPAEAAAPPPVEAPAPAAFRVSAIELGNAVGPDKRVMAPTSTFTAKDTIYASVATEGTSASSTLGARWTYQDGQVVNEESQTVSPTGPATSEFHISKPDGWPAGKYKVEISVDGVPAQSKDFEVAATP